MRRKLPIFIAVLSLSLFITRPVKACLNDRSTISVENDFKSSYLKKSDPPASVEISVGGWTAIGMGAAFTVFAGAVTLRGNRKRS